MSEIKFVAYFNALRDGVFCHLIAVGETSAGGVTPVLEPTGQPHNFKFHIKNPGGAATRVLQPFHVVLTMAGSECQARAVDVEVAGKPLQIQVHDIQGAGSGANEGGVWVKGGN